MSKKIEMFQKYAQGEGCLIGSGRCGYHNTRLGRDVTVKRVSVVNDDSVVNWMMRDVITLVCPAAQHKREDRLEIRKVVRVTGYLFLTARGGPIRKVELFIELWMTNQQHVAIQRRGGMNTIG